MTEETSVGRPRKVTDDQIFDALATAISDFGPNGFSMNTVAEHLDLTGPALGYRFGNKQGLLLAFAARQPTAAEEYLAGIAERIASPREAITESLVGLMAGMTTRAEVANNLALLLLDITDEELRPHAIAHAEIVRQHLRELLSRAGLSDADQNRVATELQILSGGTATSWAIDGTESLETTMRHWIELVLDRELPRTPRTGHQPKPTDNAADL